MQNNTQYDSMGLVGKAIYPFKSAFMLVYSLLEVFLYLRFGGFFFHFVIQRILYNLVIYIGLVVFGHKSGNNSYRWQKRTQLRYVVDTLLRTQLFPFPHTCNI